MDYQEAIFNPWLSVAVIPRFERFFSYLTLGFVICPGLGIWRKGMLNSGRGMPR
jgi:hypothetical protein